MSINRVNVTGNIVRDPELRATAGGTPVLSLRIAVNDRHRNQQTGEWEDYANYFNAIMFGNRAEAVSRHLSKGMKVAIEGKLRYRAWEHDGQHRSAVEIIVNEIEFLGSAGSGEQSGPKAARAANAQFAPALYDEDVDF
ncbi:MAG TPA: single-stranded DNA-binding protein [Rubneribacter badeniensis]|uniref:Single-stranded DNA-binding protein n=1 Tax=Rubneribacter badeniensis TaxID=2070688 RepID=A0A9D2VKS5_9ACTN|nr:single-stranded DNA-binding protein [Rubneribacter badeniensis]